MAESQAKKRRTAQAPNGGPNEQRQQQQLRGRKRARGDEEAGPALPEKVRRTAAAGAGCGDAPPAPPSAPEPSPGVAAVFSSLDVTTSVRAGAFLFKLLEAAMRKPYEPAARKRRFTVALLEPASRPQPFLEDRPRGGAESRAKKPRAAPQPTLATGQLPERLRAHLCVFEACGLVCSAAGTELVAEDETGGFPGPGEPASREAACRGVAYGCADVAVPYALAPDDINELYAGVRQSVLVALASPGALPPAFRPRAAWAELLAKYAKNAVVNPKHRLVPADNRHASTLCAAGGSLVLQAAGVTTRREEDGGREFLCFSRPAALVLKSLATVLQRLLSFELSVAALFCPSFPDLADHLEPGSTPDVLVLFNVHLPDAIAVATRLNYARFLSATPQHSVGLAVLVSLAKFPECQETRNEALPGGSPSSRLISVRLHSGSPSVAATNADPEQASSLQPHVAPSPTLLFSTCHLPYPVAFSTQRLGLHTTRHVAYNLVNVNSATADAFTCTFSLPGF
eukprot:gene3979-6171_t